MAKNEEIFNLPLTHCFMTLPKPETLVTMFKNPEDQLCESEGILLMDYEIFLCIY